MRYYVEVEYTTRSGWTRLVEDFPDLDRAMVFVVQLEQASRDRIRVVDGAGTVHYQSATRH